MPVFIKGLTVTVYRTADSEPIIKHNPEMSLDMEVRPAFDYWYVDIAPSTNIYEAYGVSTIDDAIEVGKADMFSKMPRVTFQADGSDTIYVMAMTGLKLNDEPVTVHCTYSPAAGDGDYGWGTEPIVDTVVPIWFFRQFTAGSATSNNDVATLAYGAGGGTIAYFTDSRVTISDPLEIVDASPTRIYPIENPIFLDDKGLANAKPILVGISFNDLSTAVVTLPNNNYFSYERPDYVGFSSNGWYFYDTAERNTADIEITWLEDTSLIATQRLILRSGQNPYDPGGTTQPGGGGGSFITPESVILTEDIPNGSVEADAGNAKLFTRYLMNPSELASFGDWLWVDNFGEAIARDYMSLFYGSPMESIISCMSYPFAINSLPVTSTIGAIYWGNKATSLASYILNSSGAKIDWGSIAIGEYWGNFLDYAPHTKIELYLPWGTGFVPIDPNEVMNGSIQVITNIELDKGTCVHNVFNQAGSIIGQYSGTCGKQIPITALDSSGKALNLVTGAVATIVAGAAGGAGISAANSAAINFGKTAAIDWGGSMAGKVAGYLPREEYISRVNALISQASKPYKDIQKAASVLASGSALAAFRTPASVQRNGSFTGSGASLGLQYPYIIISRPDQSVPEQYGHHYGYPSNIYTLLGALYGYAEIGEIHLDGIPATSDELVELGAILKGGVIFA